MYFREMETIFLKYISYLRFSRVPPHQQEGQAAVTTDGPIAGAF
jgi:hypothetical protein